MRILVLDDDDGRHTTFAANLKGNEVVHVFTYEEAVKASLDGPRFDVMFLDHDLNDLDYVSQRLHYDGDREELNGSDFARFLARDLPAELFPDLFVIHSWNPQGAKNMAAILRPLLVPIHTEMFNDHIGKNLKSGE